MLTRQARFYNVPVVPVRITNLQNQSGVFNASFEGGAVKARTVLLATGLVDVPPEIEGLKEAVESGLIRYCPVCDAFEASDRRIAVIGGESAVSKAEFLRGYFKGRNAYLVRRR